MDEWLVKWTHELMDGWMTGGVRRWLNGWLMVEQTDG